MHAFRILNVFTVDGDPFSGNPLCVFEDARGLSDAQMQSLARQMNLSETTFVLPSTREDADARVRIFTPGFEMPFAGHPTLGTASVVAAAQRKTRVTLEMIAGLVPVESNGVSRDANDATSRDVNDASRDANDATSRDVNDASRDANDATSRDANDAAGRDAMWTLRAAKAPATRAVDASRDDLSAMLGLPAGSVSEEPLWVNTGVEQLVIPLASTELVRATKPIMALIEKHGFSATREEAMAYVWARDANDDSKFTVRFFFTSNGALLEDPATGSACANLGGWMIARDAKRPMTATLSQGAEIERPSRLGLRIDERDQIFVSGAVIELGRGTIAL